MPDAAEWQRLATQYASLAARAVAAHEACKGEVVELKVEVDHLTSEIIKLHKIIGELKDTIEDKAETSGSFAAKQVLQRRDLKELRAEKKERRAFRAKVAAGIVVGLVVAVGIFVGGVFWKTSTLPESPRPAMVR